jgi:hypothetical protein
VSALTRKFRVSEPIPEVRALIFKEQRSVALKRADPSLKCWQLAERMGVGVKVIQRWLRLAGLETG